MEKYQDLINKIKILKKVFLIIYSELSIILDMNQQVINIRIGIKAQYIKAKEEQWIINQEDTNHMDIIVISNQIEIHSGNKIMV